MHAVDAFDSHGDAERLVQDLLQIMSNRTKPDPRFHPTTGVLPIWESALSPLFIHEPENDYGTRTQTVVLATQEADGRLRVRVTERTIRDWRTAAEFDTRREEFFVTPLTKSSEIAK